MNKVLFLLDSYFPVPSANAICVRKITEELVKDKIASTCIVLDDNKKSNLDIIDNIKIYRVNSRLPIRIITRNIKKNNYQRNFAKIAIQFSRLQGAFFGFFWPLLSIAEILRYYFKAKKLYKSEKFEVTVSVYKRIEAVLAGVLLKRRYPELKLVVYTLDCMSRSLVPKILNTNIALNSVKRWERFIFSKADYICIMQSHQKHYQQEEYKKFAEKFVVMDIPLFELNDKDSNINLIKNTDKINLVFTGSMDERTSDPSYFIKILESIACVPFEFNIYGGTLSVTISNNIKNSPLFGEKLFWHGIVSPHVAAQKQKEANILISFGNDNECMIPSKIFQYIALKKHVVHLYKADSDSALPYFKKYGNATLIQEKQNINIDVSQKVKDLLANIPDVKIDDHVLLEKFYNNTAEPMADFIISLLKK